MFKGLSRGQRITIVLRHKVSYTGIIKSIIQNKIEIDISYDEPLLKGSISFNTRDIATIISRTYLSEREKKEILAQKDQVLSTIIKTPQNAFSGIMPEQNEPEEKPISPSADASLKSPDGEDTEKLLELLNKFPPGAKWNQQYYQNIIDKNPILRTAEEISFLQAYKNWLKAQSLKDKQERFRFFERYLPEDGWGEEKYTELSTKYIRLKVGLSPEEQEFVDKFEVWKKTLSEYEEEQKKK